MKTAVKIMKVPKEKIRAWLGVLLCRCAVGHVDLDSFRQRLQSAIDPVFRSGFLLQALNDAVCQSISKPSTSDFKKRFIRKCEVDKIEKYTLMVQEMRKSGVLEDKERKPLTLGDLVKAWARCTGQNPHDFEKRICPGLTGLVEEWQLRTGCSGLTDVDCLLHPREAATFLDSFNKLLMKETPESNLLDTFRSITKVLQKKPSANLTNTMRTLTGKVCHFITWETEKQFSEGLGSNPEVKERLTASEVKALVEWEEIKQGWGGNTNGATELLKGALTSNSEASIGQLDKIAILDSLRKVGSRSLLTNLKAAIKGQLRARFMKDISRSLKCAYSRAVSYWEFKVSPLIDESTRSICQWLFRR